MRRKDSAISRRDAIAMTAAAITALPSSGCSDGKTRDLVEPDPADAGSADTTNLKETSDTEIEDAMQIQYLEIVTTNVDASCQLYSAVHGVTFGDADQSLGGARTTKMQNGMVGIRAPMHDGEKPVTRVYTLVSDIEAAVAAAKESGAMIAVPPMKLGNHGTCAIYIQDGIEAGFWQL